MSDPRYAAQRKYAKTRRQKYKAMVDRFKVNPCLDCGGHFHPECMDFDHVRGDKLFSISAGFNRSAEDFADELDKCELVCANCHRTRIANRRK